MTTYVVRLTATAYGLPVFQEYEVTATTVEAAAKAARAAAKAAGQTEFAFNGDADVREKEA